MNKIMILIFNTRTCTCMIIFLLFRRMRVVRLAHYLLYSVKRLTDLIISFVLSRYNDQLTVQCTISLSFSLPLELIKEYSESYKRSCSNVRRVGKSIH